MKDLLRFSNEKSSLIRKSHYRRRKRLLQIYILDPPEHDGAFMGGNPYNINNLRRRAFIRTFQSRLVIVFLVANPYGLSMGRDPDPAAFGVEGTAPQSLPEFPLFHDVVVVLEDELRVAPSGEEVDEP